MEDGREAGAGGTGVADGAEAARPQEVTGAPEGPGGLPVSAGSTEEGSPVPFEERCAELYRLVTKQPEHREIYVRALARCAETCGEADLEAYIQSLPEFAYETQSPYYLIRALVGHGGLERFELDGDGDVVTPERREGLTPDEADDLVCAIAYQTTDVGMTVGQEMAPQGRLERLVAERPQRRDTYCELLEFCLEPRSRRDVERLLDGRPILDEEAVDGEPLKPSVFLDKLERAGMLVWDGAWNTSEDGKAYLGSHVG